MFDNPEKLPEQWDAVFKGHPLKKRLFLKHLHLSNPVKQRYFWREAGDQLFAGCIYRANIPFVFGPLAFYQKASFCGVPMPFGIEPGFSPETDVAGVAEFMNKAWPGFQMVLGSSGNSVQVPGWTWKRHLLAVELKADFSSFEDYLSRLRHNYRKLINRSLRKAEGLEFRIEHKDRLDDDEYKFYLSLLSRQKLKSEALDIGFFRNIPIEHHYLKSFLNGKSVGWILLVPNGRELYTVFLGFDPGLNKKHDIYFNLFLRTIKYAIEGGFTNIHFGQTAELTKMRLGGFPSERYALVRHTNPVINWIIKNTDIFNFRRHYQPLQVFKDQ